jgi:hypothetical protein
MTPEEKIQYVKDKIDEETAISPKGPIWYFLYTVTHPDNEEWTVLSRGEQKRIIRKLEKERYIKNVDFDEEKNGFWLEKIKKRVTKKKSATKKRSNVYSHIKTTDELLQKRELFEKALKIFGEMEANHSYKHSTYEENDDLVQLLIDLDLIKYDWKEMEKQTHREIGNRIIEFSFEANKVIELKNRVSGKKGRVQKEALELISKEIGERYTLDKIVRIFTDIGVPESMFTKDTKWRAVFYVLSFYTTSNEHSNHIMFLKILERVLHPLSFEGDEGEAEKTQEKYNKYLKYDNIQMKDNKAYIGPTKEEWDLGIGDWVSSDGEVVEPKGYAIFPDKVADLWILWGQIIILISAYQNNGALDRSEMEKLYLELISKVEDLIGEDKMGHLKETYTRPFTSLGTANIEAKMKKAESPIDLISAFLIEITALEPDPVMISKKLEEHKDLIDKVTTVTRAISGDEKIELGAVSYEQALYLLKIVAGHIFQILDVVSTGYMNVADEQLNAKYVLLKDYLDALLLREDLKALKEDLPEHIPEHLFEMIEEMDIWWSECGGQSQMMGFAGSVDTLWIRSGQQAFPLPTWLTTFFNEANEIAKEHRKSKAKKWDQIIKNIDKERKENPIFEGKAEKKDPVQKHEHIHRFENSIQEKPIDFSLVQEQTKDKIKIKLSDYEITFDDETAQLHIGDFNPVSFPSHKNEHYVLRKLFSQRKKEAIDWQDIYEEMTHSKSETTDKEKIQKQKRSVKDAVLAINKRIKEVSGTDCNLIQWETKCAKRLY